MNHHQLVVLREKFKLSQVKLALLTGISRFRISQFECGYATLTEIELDKLERLLFTAVKSEN